MATHNDFGARGEAVASELLELSGYKILKTNFRYRKSEVDIFAVKGNVLAVVEVKSRSSIAFGRPENFVDAHKMLHLQRAAAAFVEENALDHDVRFDIVSVIKRGGRINAEHICDAFFYF